MDARSPEYIYSGVLYVYTQPGAYLFPKAIRAETVLYHRDNRADPLTSWANHPMEHWTTTDFKGLNGKPGSATRLLVLQMVLSLDPSPILHGEGQTTIEVNGG